jgi:thioesterase domain-containing protein
MATSRPSSKYTPEDIERGLFALAVCGNAAAAARQLKAQGHGVPRQTLLDWKVARAERFREIANKHTQEIREVIAQEQIEIAHAAGEAEREAIAKARGQLRDGSIRDASTAARNFSVTKGIALDHSLKQRGEPTIVHEHNIQVEDVFKRLRELAPQVFVIEGQGDEELALANGNGTGAA